MDQRTLAELLERVAAGEVAPDDAIHELQHLPYEALREAKIDHHRELRTGVAEAVYAPGKTPEQIEAAVSSLLQHAGGAVFVTRATKMQAEAAARVASGATWDESTGLVVVRRAAPLAATPAIVAVVSAGTSDQPVAEEAALTAEALGLTVTRIRDVGVAGLPRLLDALEDVERASCLIVVAGMEGALPSVISGMTDRPIVAVPTSVGYGAALDGITALLAMLAGCAPGVTVVNIDNGFGAAHAALRIVRASGPKSFDPSASEERDA